MKHLIVSALLLLVLQAGEALAEETSACSLLSREEASALLGADAGPGQNRPATLPAGELCCYTVQQNGSSMSLQIRWATTAAIKEEGIHESARDLYERQLRARKNSAHAAGLLQELSDLGEAAFWSGTELYLLQGDNLLLISAKPRLEGSFPNLAARDKAQATAALELSRKVAAAVAPRLR